jgi:excisionase family DNA binding protein
MSKQNAQNTAGPMAFNINAAAAQLSLSKNHVRKLIATGELKHRRAGRRVLIPRSALEAYLDVGNR